MPAIQQVSLGLSHLASLSFLLVSHSLLPFSWLILNLKI
jgi:hypothetical protein